MPALQQKVAKAMNAKDFRRELIKAMPGYAWTVRRSSGGHRLEATGSQSSGSNRTSTLNVIRTDRDGKVTYMVRSSGYGLSAPWLAQAEDGTLLRALRNLQDHYECQANDYRAHADALALGRVAAELSA